MPVIPVSPYLPPAFACVNDLQMRFRHLPLARVVSPKFSGHVNSNASDRPGQACPAPAGYPGTTPHAR